MDTTTINGLLSVKPGNEPVQGETRTFAIEHRTSRNGKAWIKIKNASPDYGGQPYRILQAEKTDFVDQHGNLSFNVEIESAVQSMEQSQKFPRSGLPPQPLTNAPQSPVARPNVQVIQDHANRAGDVFDAAWARAGKSMESLMPDSDAKAMKLEMWYDLKCRISQFIAIQTDRKM